jgi:hypothetical protein
MCDRGVYIRIAPQCPDKIKRKHDVSMEAVIGGTLGIPEKTDEGEGWQ